MHARSLLETTCDDDGLEEGLLACAAFDGTHTRVLTLGDAGLLSAAGRLDGPFRIRDVQPDGWISGWLRGAPVAAHLSARDAHRLPEHADHVYAVAAANGFAATAAWHDAGTRIRVYALNAHAPAAGR
jgi:hypothetical protein